MTNDIYVERFFPTQIFYTDHPEPASINDPLKQSIYEWQSTDDGLTKSNVGGWHSPDTMHERPEFETFRDWLIDHVDKVAQNLCLNEGSKFILDNMWANINKKGDYNKTHNHPYSSLSGVYYVKTPEPQSKLWFQDPRPGYAMWPLTHNEDEVQDKPWLWGQVHYVPREGMLILFPSYLDHWVEQNRSDEDRISISFNFYQAQKVKK